MLGRDIPTDCYVVQLDAALASQSPAPRPDELFHLFLNKMEQFKNGPAAVLARFTELATLVRSCVLARATECAPFRRLKHLCAYMCVRLYMAQVAVQAGLSLISTLDGTSRWETLDTVYLRTSRYVLSGFLQRVMDVLCMV